MGSSAVGNLMPRSEAPGTMAFRPSAAHRELASRLRKAARPKRGFALRASLGPPVPALGVRTADAVAIRKAFVRSHPDPSADEVHSLLASLWSGATFEERSPPPRPPPAPPRPPPPPPPLLSPPP